MTETLELFVRKRERVGEKKVRTVPVKPMQKIDPPVSNNNISDFLQV
jgi:hypothetical protein